MRINVVLGFMKLEISHLQFTAISLIGSGRIAGKELRQKLMDKGIDRSYPAFYQLMARLEDAGLVAGVYDQKKVNGKTVRFRKYSVTRHGANAYNNMLKHYKQLKPI